MLIEKYTECEEWRAGYREACFDLCVGNLDKDKAYELARDADEEDVYEDDCDNCDDCDLWNLGYKKGYQEGYADGVEDEDDYDYAEDVFEVEIERLDLDKIEDIKKRMRDLLNDLNGINANPAILRKGWKVVDELYLLERSIAGKQVIDEFFEIRSEDF